MQSFQPFTLSEHNTLGVPASCPQYFEPANLEEFKLAYAACQGNFYLLGEGSNTLFVDTDTPAIIRPRFLGKSTRDLGDYVLLTVSCGENWHQLVTYCVANGYYGIENLALIPGSVGAAPVQNIGAYGVELSDVVHAVSWFDFAQQKVIELEHSDCQFSYRESIFKNTLQSKGVITQVTFKLSKTFTAKLSYNGLNFEQDNVTAADVMQRVIEIRESKLPDPSKLPNAGSFFKNPIVEQAQYQALIAKYPHMPSYKMNDNTYKLAAGWLIEKAGLKGFRLDGVGVHEKQALVLINYDGMAGNKIVELATIVMNKVDDSFNILLEPEVRFVNHLGLTSMSECQ
ncbi:UDP-N-acetylmuramate dehydrogenase [Thalassotalea sediminis]|uniref:UDP-N-acetylmuramate dehydrogenase n=1 Tax=Thalassotalea sediminis TaxID=1759089 RepID=UPI0025734A39|nr:UDP-N-acetylmuramate dehydrogenase [Thalassotalea sediminis]